MRRCHRKTTGVLWRTVESVSMRRCHRKTTGVLWRTVGSVSMRHCHRKTTGVLWRTVGHLFTVKQINTMVALGDKVNSSTAVFDA